MIVKLMGFLDLMTAVMFLLLHYNIVRPAACIYFLFYLVVKAVAFWGDFASILDGLSAVYMVLMFLGLRYAITFVVVIYLGQKALFSLLA